MIPFGKWTPDVFSLNSNLASDIKGALPGAASKRPWPSLAAYSDAMSAVCRGAILVRDASGNNQIFAGTAEDLFKLNAADLSWTNVTRSAGGTYSVPDNERWQFTIFGADLYASQIGDVMQSITMASGTNFAAVAGSPPQVRYIKTVGDQIFAASDTSKGNRLSWCGRNNPTFWTFGGGQDCDQQEFPDGGYVRGIAGINSGFIFQDEAVRAFQPTAGREIYSFVKIDGASGLAAADSLVSYLDTHFYLGTDGFRSIGANGIQRIGLEQVDEWFLANASNDTVRRGLTCGVIDPNRPRIFWGFTTQASGYVLDHILAYDIALKEWTHAEVSFEFLLKAATAGYTMESLASLFANLDTLGISLDDRVWSGGSPVVAAIDDDHILSFFSGAAMAAVLDTVEFQAVPGRRAFVRGIRPIVDAANVTVSVGTRNTLATTENVSFRTAQSLNSSGVAPARASGRYHTIRCSIAAGETWHHAQGVEPDAVPEGQR